MLQLIMILIFFVLVFDFLYELFRKGPGRGISNVAKIIRLSTPKSDVVDVLEQILQLAKQGEIKNIALAAEHSTNREVLTGYANSDVSERQYLISHMQSDITLSIVAENLVEF